MLSEEFNVTEKPDTAEQMREGCNKSSSGAYVPDAGLTVGQQLREKIKEFNDAPTIKEVLTLLLEIATLLKLSEPCIKLETNGLLAIEVKAPASGPLVTEEDADPYELVRNYDNTAIILSTSRPPSAVKEMELKKVLLNAAMKIEGIGKIPWDFEDDFTKHWNVTSAVACQMEREAGGNERKICGELESDYQKFLGEEIGRVANLPSIILLLGETGTGKTKTAQDIHRRSLRAKEKFIDLNCAALTETLVERELFGCKKGAYSGADADSKGLFETAHGGTVFLDEVGELSLAVQAKLLKAIEERKVRRLGETEARTFDARIIAGTARNLREMVKKGLFREDLYWRLAGMKIEVLPLRKRKREIPNLVKVFLAEADGDHRRIVGQSHHPFRIETRALELLCEHEWAGNVRELKSAVHQLASRVENGDPVSSRAVRRCLAEAQDTSEEQPIAPRKKVSIHIDPQFTTPETARTGARRLREIAEMMENIRSEEASKIIARELLGAVGVQIEEGDIITDFESVVIRRHETLAQHQDRTMVMKIDAARMELKTWRKTSERLGEQVRTLRAKRQRVGERVLPLLKIQL